jgi:hypothetical protein
MVANLVMLLATYAEEPRMFGRENLAERSFTTTTACSDQWRYLLYDAYATGECAACRHSCSGKRIQCDDKSWYSYS